MKLKTSDLRRVTYQIQTPKIKFYDLIDQKEYQTLISHSKLLHDETVGLLCNHIYYENIEYYNYN